MFLGRVSPWGLTKADWAVFWWAGMMWPLLPAQVRCSEPASQAAKSAEASSLGPPLMTKISSVPQKAPLYFLPPSTRVGTSQMSQSNDSLRLGSRPQVPMGAEAYLPAVKPYVAPGPPVTMVTFSCGLGWTAWRSQSSRRIVITLRVWGLLTSTLVPSASSQPPP